MLTMAPGWPIAAISPYSRRWTPSKSANFRLDEPALIVRTCGRFDVSRVSIAPPLGPLSFTHLSGASARVGNYAGAPIVSGRRNARWISGQGFWQEVVYGGRRDRRFAIRHRNLVESAHQIACGIEPLDGRLLVLVDDQAP